MVRGKSLILCFLVINVMKIKEEQDRSVLGTLGNVAVLCAP